MKKRLFLFALAAIALVAYSRYSADAAPNGLVYDQIVRFVGAATPPPPGNFENDYTTAMNSAVTAAVSPAPHHRMSLGAIAGAIAGGQGIGSAIAGNAADTAAQNGADTLSMRAMGPMFSAFGSLMHGRVERYAFYNGWERVDDLTAQTATITKCDLHQIIKLDLAKKTYQIIDTSVKGGSTSTAHSGGTQSTARTPAGQPQRPGTMQLTISHASTALGAANIDGVPASGYRSTFAMTASQATGSCRNGQFSVTTTEYLSVYAELHSFCPLPAQHVSYPTVPTEMVAPPSSGCKPTMAFKNSGGSEPSGRLSLYSLMTMNGNGQQAKPSGAGFSLLTERGHVRQLNPSDEKLFEIPAGYTKVNT